MAQYNKRKDFPLSSLDIDLDLGGENQRGDSWEQKAVAVVKNPKKEPVEGIKVRFFLDENSYGQIETTEEDGRAIMMFPGLLSGNHTFEALIVGTIKRKRRIKNFSDQSKKPADLIWEQTGSEGKFYVTFQVLSEERNPVKNVIIRILDKKIANFFKDLDPTDKNGTQSHNFEFLQWEKRRDITALIIGSEIKKEIHVFN